MSVKSAMWSDAAPAPALDDHSQVHSSSLSLANVRSMMLGEWLLNG